MAISFRVEKKTLGDTLYNIAMKSSAHTSGIVLFIREPVLNQTVAP